MLLYLLQGLTLGLSAGVSPGPLQAYFLGSLGIGGEVSSCPIRNRATFEAEGNENIGWSVGFGIVGVWIVSNLGGGWRLVSFVVERSKNCDWSVNDAND